jgi:hypothetical protein
VAGQKQGEVVMSTIPHTQSPVTPVRQLTSHSCLMTDVSAAPVPAKRSRRGRPDAIIVPATRPASWLTGLVELSAELETRLVVLCSRQANVDQVVTRIGKVARARGVVVNLGEDSYKPDFPARTSSDDFRAANGGRKSDLSTKRNFGLLLARLSGWSKVVFIDDDITVSWSDIGRLSNQLDTHQIAGMVCRDFPDNSVVCHARRLAKLPQDNFVTGAVLGVNCNDLPRPYFPDIYNEDWFSFAEPAARHQLANAGNARQAEYEPFRDHNRARHEEFGDLLAEGLYSRFESNGPHYTLRAQLRSAHREYWSRFIAARLGFLGETKAQLLAFQDRYSFSDHVDDAVASLDTAREHLESDAITSDLCVQFLDAWQDDLADWKKISKNNDLGGPKQALEYLEVPEWKIVP